MINVTVLYFGQLRQAAAMSEECVQTLTSTPAELFEERAQALGFKQNIASLRFARNEAFCGADENLSDGDTIAFMPPMAGG